MAEKSCLFEIHSRLPTLSGKERRVAEYIFANPREAVNPTIEELAERVGVSETTLFRFVRKLGYGGYQQFRIALATETVDPRDTVYEHADAGGDDESTLAAVFRTDIAALEHSLSVIDRGAVAALAEAAARAKCVLFFGLGGSSVVAQDAYHRFLRTGVDCSAPLDFHLQLMAASQARESDLGIIFSHTGANKDALAIAEALRDGGARLAVVTDGNRSPLARLAEILVDTRAGGSGPAAESYSARIVQMAVIDAVYLDVMRHLGDRGVDALARMRKTIAKRRL